MRRLARTCGPAGLRDAGTGKTAAALRVAIGGVLFSVWPAQGWPERKDSWMYEPRASEDAWAHRLWRARPALMRHARRRLPSTAWAEDAVAETLLCALEQRANLEALDSLEAWLTAVLRHKIADQWRQHGPPSDSAEPADDRPAPAHDEPERAVAWRQWVQQVERQLQRLPPLQAQALWLHLTWEVGAAEIGSALGITAGHSGVLLHRARRRLQELLPGTAPG